MLGEKATDYKGDLDLLAMDGKSIPQWERDWRNPAVWPCP